MNNSVRLKKYIERINADPSYGHEVKSSNVFANHGVLYSYGRHYPVAFKAKNTWVVNTSGYSVSTAKHINYVLQALRELGSDFVCGELGGEYLTTKQDALANMVRNAATQYDKVLDELENHTRKSNTFKIERLNGELESLKKDSEKLTGLMISLDGSYE